MFTFKPGDEASALDLARRQALPEFGTNPASEAPVQDERAVWINGRNALTRVKAPG